MLDMMRESFLGSANLIVYEGRTNIFYETVDFLCIIGVLEEIREVLLGRHRVHSLANLVEQVRWYILNYHKVL